MPAVGRASARARQRASMAPAAPDAPHRFRLPHDARPMENSRRADRHDRLVDLGALSPRPGGAGGAAGDHAAGPGAHGLGVCRLRPPGRDHGGRRAGDERRAGENGRRRRVGGSPDSAQRRAADHAGGARQRWRAAVGLHEQCGRTGAADASRPGSTVTQMAGACAKASTCWRSRARAAARYSACPRRRWPAATCCCCRVETMPSPRWRATCSACRWKSWSCWLRCRCCCGCDRCELSF